MHSLNKKRWHGILFGVSLALLLSGAAAFAKDKGVDTVAGPLGKAGTKSRSGAELDVITLAGKPILVAPTARHSWSILKKFDVGETTVVLIEEAEYTGGNATCGNAFRVLTISRSAAIRASEWFGQCTVPVSRVEGKRIVFESPAPTNDFLTEIWVYENGQVTKAVSRQAPELRRSGALQKIDPESKKRHRVAAVVKKDKDGSLYLQFKQPVRIEGEFCGPYVTDRVSIHTYPVTPPPSGTSGMFEIALDCPRAGPMATKIRYSGSNSLAVAAAIPNAFRGMWAVSAKECHGKAVEILGFPDPGGVVKADGISRNEEWCELKRVKKSAAKEFAGEFSCNESGDKRRVSMVLKLGADGTLSGAFGGAPRFLRCK